MTSAKTTLHGHGEPEPIGLEYVAAAVKMAGYDVAFRSRQQVCVAQPGKAPEIALFSSTTAEHKGVEKEAVQAKKEGLRTVIGGYHASGIPEAVAGAPAPAEAAFQKFIPSPFDYVVKGEGEEAVVAIARSIFEQQPLQCEYERVGGSDSVIVKAQRLNNLDRVEPPMRIPEFLGHYNIFDFMWPPESERRNIALMLGARGCQYDCSFCASSTVWGSGLRARPSSDVVDEIRSLKERCGTNTLVFIDQSLGQNLPWTLELCKAIEEAKLSIHWYQQSNLTVKREAIAAMARAGCTKIGFGLEALTPRVLSKIKPVNPRSFEEINQIFDYCRSLGLFVKAYAIMGFPWETERDLKDYLADIATLRCNEVKISFFTPFPGTDAWREHSSRLITTDWADFDTVRKPVVYNPDISVGRYLAARSEMFRAFYGSQTYAEVTGEMLQQFPHYSQSYKEFTQYLLNFKMVEGNESWLMH